MAKTKRTPVDFSELGGFRYLHFGSEWIQGGMRINRPYSLALEYQQVHAGASFLPSGT